MQLKGWIWNYTVIFFSFSLDLLLILCDAISKIYPKKGKKNYWTFHRAPFLLSEQVSSRTSQRGGVRRPDDNAFWVGVGPLKNKWKVRNRRIRLIEGDTTGVQFFSPYFISALSLLFSLFCPPSFYKECKWESCFHRNFF